MISKTKRNIIIGVSALIIFLLGSAIGVKAATSDWMSKISSDAAVEINAAGKSKADALTANVQAEIENTVKDKISPIVDSKKLSIQSSLQAYFDLKASTVTDSASYNAAVLDLDRIEKVLLDSYKAQIDAAFAGQ